MLSERIEGKWIDAFVHSFALCQVKAGDAVAILSETQSRQVNVHLAELALLRIGARPFHVVLPTPPQNAPVPVRSTGSSFAIGELTPVIHALSACSFVADLTVEGLMHSKEFPVIRQAGTRVLYISNEHPEALERLVADASMKGRIRAGRELLLAAKSMHVRSDAGSDLRIDMRDAMVGGNVGFCDEPGQLATWPGGICSCFPAAGAVNGVLVLDEGDINLTFKRYLERPVTLVIENDFVQEIRGTGLDADLMRSYFAAWGDRNAYGVSHVGWGMNPAARWESLVMYDKGDTNGTEQRAYAGNFLYSTGANPRAGRHTLGHFDLPVRNCDIHVDDQCVVRRGELQSELF
ncbi:peptidase M29 [Variovorax sp. J22P271]|uniref:peptidase M29 n=1 Tax=Variovorax davisae TaxID=3053515 RepID=UPI0025783D51|nr:peptidase M29 [Variovorax sp. J22P271]MDM0032396.1 peptidase M29 [Variovorax sp. J22P271]